MTRHQVIKQQSNFSKTPIKPRDLTMRENGSQSHNRGSQADKDIILLADNHRALQKRDRPRSVRLLNERCNAEHELRSTLTSLGFTRDNGLWVYYVKTVYKPLLKSSSKKGTGSARPIALKAVFTKYWPGRDIRLRPKLTRLSMVDSPYYVHHKDNARGKHASIVVGHSNFSEPQKIRGWRTSLFSREGQLVHADTRGLTFIYLHSFFILISDASTTFTQRNAKAVNINNSLLKPKHKLSLMKWAGPPSGVGGQHSRCEQMFVKAGLKVGSNNEVKPRHKSARHRDLGGARRDKLSAGNMCLGPPRARSATLLPHFALTQSASPGDLLGC
ncbi:hypothetical protein J6590_051657 [Homalodisca vitripennis]|nr:hypothetical protein J6590_051657 [Homalodisca vitripennis]